MTIATRTIEYRGDFRRYLRVRADCLRLIDRRICPRRPNELHADKNKCQRDGNPFQDPKKFFHVRRCFWLLRQTNTSTVINPAPKSKTMYKRLLTNPKVVS